MDKKKWVELSGFKTLEERDRLLEEAWAALEDLPYNDETECVAVSVPLDPGYGETNYFPAGTHREEIWKWFDQRHSQGVAWLLYRYDARNPAQKSIKTLFERSKLCLDCESEHCIFNPYDICLFPMISGRRAHIDDDGCHDCILNLGQPEVCCNALPMEGDEKEPPKERRWLDGRCTECGWEIPDEVSYDGYETGPWEYTPFCPQCGAAFTLDAPKKKSQNCEFPFSSCGSCTISLICPYQEDAE